MQITVEKIFLRSGIGAAMRGAGSEQARGLIGVPPAARRYFRNLVNYLETLPLREYPYPNLNPRDQKAGGN